MSGIDDEEMVEAEYGDCDEFVVDAEEEENEDVHNDMNVNSANTFSNGRIRRASCR